MSVDRIIVATAIAFGIQPAEIRGTSRSKSIVRARHVAMLLARELTEASFPELGRAFWCDHTTVINGCERAKELLADATVAMRLAAALRTELEGGC